MYFFPKPNSKMHKKKFKLKKKNIYIVYTYFFLKPNSKTKKKKKFLTWIN